MNAVRANAVMCMRWDMRHSDDEDAYGVLPWYERRGGSSSHRCPLRHLLASLPCGWVLRRWPVKRCPSARMRAP